MLVQFARMGAAYAEKVMGVAYPAVGLINNGTEESKGGELQLARQTIVLAARAAGIDALDTVYSDVNNEEQLLYEARLIKDRRFYAFGSYTWAGASVRLLNEYATSLNFELLGDGLSFPQAYTREKVDMATVAKMLA